MSISPGYGETPVAADELDALLPSARELLGERITKAAVYDLEQGIQEQVAEDLLGSVLAGDLDLNALLADRFVRGLHWLLYGDVWVWAGELRKRETNIGVPPEQIPVELRNSTDAISYRWNHTNDWTAHQLGIAVHAETVRIHPFTDGNGRTTRLLADLVFAAAQGPEAQESYNWNLDKRRYILLLREYDQHRNPTDLADFVTARSFGE